MKQKIRKFISLSLSAMLILLFIVCAGSIIFGAAGYRIESKSRKIYQTSMVVVKSQPRDATCILDGVEQAGMSVWRISNVAPGNHKISVAKEGYQNWMQTFAVTAGETKIYEDIVLFLRNPTPIASEKNNNQNLFNKLLEQNVDDRIIVKNETELWYNDELVTRFSQKVAGIKLYPDNRHVAYISKRELHIIDIDGSNDMAIIKLPSDNYMFLDSGATVVYIDGEELKSAKIR